MAVAVRAATRQDCGEIRRLIQELADYEKMPDGPKIGDTTLEHDGFDDPVFYHCLVAESSQEETHLVEAGAPHLVGYAVYFYVFLWSGQAMHMEDLYVTPKHRAKGVGSQLWRALVEKGLARGAKECRFVVLDWNSPSIAYYKNKGAINTTAVTGYQLLRMTKPVMQTFIKNIRQTEGISIRIVESSDFVSINAMHKELAEHMNVTEHMKLTVDMTSKAALSKPADCHILVATTDSGELIGFTLFCYIYSTWEGRSIGLEDFYVKKNYRGKNIGTRLLQTVVQHGLAAGCSRVDIVTTKDNQAAIAYYQKHGAVDLTKEEGWLRMLLPYQEMINMTKT